jgi:hypothetical protein
VTLLKSGRFQLLPPAATRDIEIDLQREHSEDGHGS